MFTKKMVAVLLAVASTVVVNGAGMLARRLVMVRPLTAHVARPVVRMVATQPDKVQSAQFALEKAKAEQRLRAAQERYRIARDTEYSLAGLTTRDARLDRETRSAGSIRAQAESDLRAAESSYEWLCRRG